MKSSVQFIPLTFITTADDVASQIRNTVVFSYLMNLYSETNLGSYLENTQYGFTSSALNSGSHRLLRITDINNGVVDWKSVPYCNCDPEDKYLLKQRDILIARTGGTTGKSFLVNDVPENSVFASYLIRLRVKPEHEIEFINAFLNSYVFWSQIVEMKSGSAQPNVNAEKLKELRLPQCEIEVQKDVVRLLKGEPTLGLESVRHSVTSTIEKFGMLSTLNDELVMQTDLVGQLRQSILQEAVQGKLVRQNPDDKSAEELLKQLKIDKKNLVVEGKVKKEKALPSIMPNEFPFELPHGWVWCRLADVCDLITDGTHQTPTYTTQGRMFLSAQNVKPFRFIPDVFRYVSEADYQGYIKNRKPELNDVLLTRVGAGIGEAAMIDQELEFGFYVSLALLKPTKNLVFPRYLELYLNSPLGRRHSFDRTLGRGVSAGNLNLGLIRHFEFPLPPKKEQERIVAKVRELNSLCDELEESIKQTKMQAEQLLHVILTEAFLGKEEEVA